MNVLNMICRLSLVSIFIISVGCKDASETKTKAVNAPGESVTAPQKQAVAKPEAKQAETEVKEGSLQAIGTRYQAEAKMLMQSIKENQSEEKLNTQANQLTKTGLEMIPLLSTKYPQCAAYFAALTKASLTFATLSLEAIEKDYHQDGKLPKSPDGACYHGKDLVVHPATVQIMAKAGIKTPEQQKSAAHEIEEVLAHLTAVMQ